MKLLRIDHVAPQGAPIQLHPQLTVVRGATPEMRRKLIDLFRAFSIPSTLECTGMIEVGSVQLALDQLTLQGLDLDPKVNAVLQWSAAAPTTITSTTAAPELESTLAKIQEQVDEHSEELRQIVLSLSLFAERMEQVRTSLDSAAALDLDGCQSQIGILESQRLGLRAQWEHDRQLLQTRRDDLLEEISLLNEKLDMVVLLDLQAVCAARDELKSLLTASLIPDPVAQELALRIYNSLRNLREITDLAVAATSRRIEAEQNLDAAQDDLVASTSVSLSQLPNQGDLERLEELRNEIFSYPSTFSSPQVPRPQLSLQELRSEESALLQRLGYESYSAYVRGIPFVQTDLERASRRERAVQRVQQLQQDLQDLLEGCPDPQDLELAEMELSVMLQTAAELLGTGGLAEPGGQTPPAPAFPPAPASGPPSAAAADAQRADNVREVVALLRDRKVAAVVLDSSEVLQAANRLRQAVERAAGPGLNETWLHAESSTESPEDLLRGVDLWLAVFQDPADWVASTQAQINDLRAQISNAEAEELHQGDLSEWAQVEAELDRVMDQMIEAQTRSAQHDQAMMQLAELRDQELQLRSQESELLRFLAQAETQLQQAQLQAQLQAPALQVPASNQVLPPTYRSGSGGVHQRSTADDCEWALIERVAQQRAISFLGSIPLLIDSLPSDPLAQHKIIERAREMSAIVQMVILSENQWLFDQAQSGSFAATAIQF
ncbi:hypothetical protein IMCC26207_102139 [Actinobacteria bacterium IMCC26207]|nr:hypothetical protein IMCC26207_102139 [Actinobacteria bacterium IMCC26207]